MRSLIGYLKKTLLAISLVLFFTQISFAQEAPFDVSSSFVHRVNGQNVTTELTIYLTTKTTKVLSLYTTSIQAKDIKAKCYSANGNPIKCESYNRTSTTDVQMDLKNTVVTPERPLEIKIIYSYNLQNEITYSFPSKVLDATTTDVKIIHPKEKGDFSWSSENIVSKELRGDVREVLFKNPTKDSVSIFFDKHIQYSFNINRQFTNDSEKQGQTYELVVPLDDANQIVVWEQIDPLPTSAIQDEDGNYILKYLVKSGDNISVKLSGYVLKEESVKKAEEPQQYLTLPNGLWEIRDSTENKRIASFMKEKGLDINPMMSDIKTLKPSERSLFYKFLYQYVMYRLEYSKNISLGIENSARLQVSDILEKPMEVGQVDYADLYMALLRNYSIPSRMIVGYVSNISGHTTDGFYHHWVEYFDEDKEKWVQVDPFLEEYFGYTIFGTQLNDHITILKRGKSVMSPTLTFYTPTDFIVRIDTEKKVEKNISVNSALSFDNYDITKPYAKAYITTSNTGNVIISKIDLLKSNIGDIKKYLDSVNNNSSSILLPKHTSNIQLNIPTEKIYFNTISITTRYRNNASESIELNIANKVPSDIPIYAKVLAKIFSLLSFGILLLLFYTIFKLMQKKKWIQQ